MSETGGTLQIRTGSADGPVVAEVHIPKSAEWKLTKTALVKLPKGVQNLFVILKDNKALAVDWIRFE